MLIGRIRNLRDELNVTQQTLADRLNISREAYSQYETGKRMPPLDILLDLSRLHGVSMDYLLNLTNDKKPYVLFSNDEKKLMNSFRRLCRREKMIIELLTVYMAKTSKQP